MAEAARQGNGIVGEYPGLGTGPIPTLPYYDPDYFEKERERIFRRSWLNLGRIEELPEVGDYVVRDVAILGTSVLLVHTADGIQAFHNVCTHRGNKIAWDESGNAKGFSCRFHGWTFDTAGELKHVPDEEQFYDLDKSSNGLAKIHTAVWEGFVFVSLAAEPAQSLKEFLGEMAQSLEGYSFDKFTTCSRFSGEVNVNWKIFMDAFQEGYHVLYLHKRSVAAAFSSDDAPGMRLASDGVLLTDQHRRITGGWGNPNYQPKPTELLAHKFGGVLNELTAESDLPRGVNPTRDPRWIMDINVFFPNFELLLSNNWFLSYNFWPVSENKTVYEVRMFYPEAKNAAQRFTQEFNRAKTRDALLEDLSTLEEIQRMIESGALESFHFSDQEILCRHAFNAIERAVNEE